MAAVMDALAAVTVPSIPASSRFAWPQSSVVPPAWVIGYPQIDEDLSFVGGYVTATFPCWYITGEVDQKSARNRLSVVLGGTSRIKTAIEGTATLNGSGGSPVAQSTRVTSVQPETVVVGAVNLLAARFEVEVLS